MTHDPADKLGSYSRRAVQDLTVVETSCYTHNNGSKVALYLLIPAHVLTLFLNDCCCRCCIKHMTAVSHLPAL